LRQAAHERIDESRATESLAMGSREESKPVTDLDTGAPDSTREQLLNAAEMLYLERGLDEVSLRAIVREAGQKNQSALQYHFGGRHGLVAAILHRREAQIESRRQLLVEERLATDPDPELREICALLTRAPFLLCRENRTFRVFLGEFGQRLLASKRDLIEATGEGSQPSLRKMRAMLRQKLRHIEPGLLMLRFENAHAFTLLAISRRARHGGSFRGRRAELFFNNLVDQLAAMLAAPVSEATRAELDAGSQYDDSRRDRSEQKQ
jgi:AcrR family transcriptional regulator